MSTYLTAEAALLAVCRQLDGGAVYTAANSAVDDWRVLDAADTPDALIVEMGGPSTEGDTLDAQAGAGVTYRGSMGALQERHLFDVTVARKVGTGETGVTGLLNDLKQRTEALKAHLRRHDRLGYAPDIQRAWPVRTGPPQSRAPHQGAPPTHLTQTIAVEVFAEIEYPESEGGA